MTRAEKASIAYQLVAHGPRVMGGDAVLSDDDFKFWNINYDFVAGYEQALKDIGIVNELIDQKGVAIVDTVDNYSGHQTINTIRFVGEDEDKPRPLPCKYYHVWLKAAKEEEL